MNSLISISQNDMAACFGYLDILRGSGVTNMFGARPYLVRDCALDEKTALFVLKAWMDSDLQLTPTERVALYKARGE